MPHDAFWLQLWSSRCGPSTAQRLDQRWLLRTASLGPHSAVPFFTIYSFRSASLRLCHFHHLSRWRPLTQFWKIDSEISLSGLDFSVCIARRDRYAYSLSYRIRWLPSGARITQPRLGRCHGGENGSLNRIGRAEPSWSVAAGNNRSSVGPDS